MGREMLWVTRGPIAGTFVEADSEDIDLAEAEGWGQRTVGRDHMQMHNPDKSPHEKAEAWLARQPGYANRELRPAPAPSPAPPAQTDKDDDEVEDKAPAKPKATTPKKK